MPEYEPRPARSQLQRRELGPILHALSNEVYDVFLAGEPEAKIEVPDMVTPSELRISIKALQEMLSGIIRLQETSRGEAWADFEEWLELQKGVVGLGQSLTHYDTARSVMYEGISSGLLFPVNLCLAAADQRLLYTPDNRLPARFIIDTLRRPDFIDANRRIAHSANGFVGSIVSVSNVIDPGENQYPASMVNAITFSDEDDTYRLTEEKERARLIKLRTANTSPNDWSLQTGGCPVRHEGFPVLGEFATAFLAKHGYEQPAADGVSLIERGMQVTATVLERATAA